MIPIVKPYLDENELEQISQVLSSGLLTQGPKTLEFEKMVAEMTGSQYAFAMSSCTTALHLALVALNIKPGDEVLVADFTFPATANVVVQLGAKPVLVDIDLDTFTINPQDLQKKITPKTKAIIPVDAFGLSADYDSILKIANERHIPVIEDAATTLGAKYYDRYCGNLTAIGCFSFHPRKVITTGEGGMITTNDSNLAEKIKLLRSHGGVRKGAWFEYEAAGFNYRLSDILSAVGVAQMKKLDYLIKRKRELASELSNRLSNIAGVQIPTEPKWGGHIYQSYVVLLDETINRNRVIDSMKTQGVETTIGTYALHDQPFFQKTYGYNTGDLANSHIAFTQSVTLPLYPQMTASDLDRIADTLTAAIHSA